MFKTLYSSTLVLEIQLTKQYISHPYKRPLFKFNSRFGFELNRIQYTTKTTHKSISKITDLCSVKFLINLL